MRTYVPLLVLVLFAVFFAWVMLDVAHAVTQQVQPLLTGQYCKQAQNDARAAMDWARANAERDPAGAMKRIRDVTGEIARICPDTQ
jgi:hypothetical protein